MTLEVSCKPNEAILGLENANMKTIGSKTKKNVTIDNYLHLSGIHSSNRSEPIGLSDYDSDSSYRIAHLDSPNISEMIIPALIKYIKAKALMPGDILPSEKELCELVGVGNRAMREALMILRSTGLLQARTGKGWYVGKFDPARSLRFLSPLLNYLPDAEDFDQILNTRLIIEPPLTGLTARNITPEGLKQLDHLMVKMQELEEHSNMNQTYDMEFHTIIAQHCGNHILMVVNSILIDLMGTVLKTLVLRELQPAYAVHYPIYEAIKSGDQAKAEMASIEHIQNGRGVIHRYLASLADHDQT